MEQKNNFNKFVGIAGLVMMLIIVALLLVISAQLDTINHAVKGKDTLLGLELDHHNETTSAPPHNEATESGP